MRLLSRFGDVIAAWGGWLFSVSLYYPGIMSNDSRTQFRQAVTGSYRDGDPPLMAFVWSLTNRVIFGPAGMLILHTVLFWCALWLFARALTSRPWLRVITILAFGFYPPVFAQFGTIWKDTALSVSFFLAAVLIDEASRRKTRGARVLVAGACCCLFYGVGVRYNAAPAALPFCAWAAWQFLRLAGQRVRKLPWLAVTLGLFFALVGGNAWTRKILVPDGYNTFQYFVIVDLSALSVASNESLVPSFVSEEPLTFADYRKLSTPPFSAELAKRVSRKFTPEEYRELKTRWLKQVVRMPFAYLAHRTRWFAPLLGIGTSEGVFFQDHTVENDWGITFTPPPLFWKFIQLWYALSWTIVFKPYFYALLCAGSLLYGLWNRPAEPLPLVLASSGLLYLSTYFPSAPGLDFRYHYWMILAAIAATLSVAKRFGKQTSHSA